MGYTSMAQIGTDGGAAARLRRPSPEQGSPSRTRTQAPSAVMMVRPHRFRPNQQTAADNHFQTEPDASRSVIAQRAYDEVTRMVEQLRGRGVDVLLLEDEGTTTPDSVFPNNWITTHPTGLLATFPMYAENRRLERRADALELLQERFHVYDTVDLSAAELEGEALEGTGVMIFDHLEMLAYACRSKRLSSRLFDEFCELAGYTPILFDATDSDGVPVYHTNVMMALGTDLAVIGASMIRDGSERRAVLGQLRDTGREVVELTEEQIGSFAGNCLEVQGADGRLLVMSRTGVDSLSRAQRDRIESRVELLPVDVHTLELAGGSARCMLAGIHLEPRQVHTPRA
ncbi:citrulline utilization hydrolase CtlX [Helcobacillus massiliensis]|uniref:citrulline utilization hydrolase CtlX n=2 Tax=Helcobacillus massiliensis TaxID=521392 RepID=UPI002557A5F7|nr:arginine deiminase-related protein [Helcobacillus massiliensis]